MQKNLFNLIVIVFISIQLHAQCIEGNCTDGIGSFIYPSGAKYTGQFAKSQIHGIGTLWMNNGNVYSGQWKQNYRDGLGKMEFKNGDIYFGSFIQSRLEGTGTMKFAQGGSYKGSWLNNLPNGKGSYIYANGETYAGLVVDGRRQGAGRFTYTDLSIYDGQWADNQRYGQGTLIYPDGKKITAMWDADQMTTEAIVQNEPVSPIPAPKPQIALPSTGPTSSSMTSLPVQTQRPLKNCTDTRCHDEQGYFVFKDGSKYVGPFKNGNPYGNGILYYANGDRYEGQWDDVAPHGQGIMYFSSGRVYAAIWERGKPIKQLENRAILARRPDIKPQKDDEIKVWTVIVGVARYAHMPVLKYADDDAYQIYAFLKSPEGGAVPDQQIKILIDEDATHHNIINAIQEQFGKADENDLVMLYYSGHGIPGAFLPIDFNGYDNKLYHDDITSIMESSQAKHKLFLIDACYAGSMTDPKADLSTSINKYYDILEHERGGTAYILSSKNREVSLEDSGLRQGIFSHYLIRGLKGEADQNHNKIVTVQELFNFINTHVQSYTNNTQNPTIDGKYNPQMPVAFVRE